MLTKAQLGEYHDVGAIVVTDVLSMDEIQRLRRVTDEFVEACPQHHRAQRHLRPGR